MADNTIKFPFSDEPVELHPIDEREKEKFDKIRKFLEKLKNRKDQNIEEQIIKILDLKKAKSADELEIMYRAIKEILENRPKTSNIIINYIRRLMKESERDCNSIHAKLWRKYKDFNKSAELTAVLRKDVDILIPEIIPELAIVRNFTPENTSGTENKRQTEVTRVPAIKEEYRETIQDWNDYAIFEKKIAERIYQMQFNRIIDTNNFECRGTKIVPGIKRKIKIWLKYVNRENTFGHKKQAI